MSAFSDKAFLRVQRERQRPIGKIICFIGAVVLTGYIISGPFFIPQQTLASFTYSCLIMIVVVISYYFLLGTEYYVENAWVDAPIFTAAFACQIGINRAFFPVAAALYTTPTSIVFYNSSVFVSCLAVGIAGSFSVFSFTAVLVISVCCLYAFYITQSLGAVISQAGPILTALAISSWANYTILRESHSLWLKKQHSENLLFNVLPEEVVKRLKDGETIADSFSEVGVIFVDLVDFSALSEKISAKHLVEVLNSFFLLCDRVAEETGIEKVKTIGDAYMGVAGTANSDRNCAVEAICFAKRIIDELAKSHKHGDLELEVRIGIDVGSVVGGIIGAGRRAYDYWGATVNLASRIQGAAMPSQILVSEAAYYRAKTEIKFGLATVEILKGIGERKLYPVSA